MPNLCNKEQCTGCGACFNICPKQAITIIQNENGFYNPKIDKEKCINCGLCEKSCPINNYKSQNFKHPKVYSFQNNDSETLFKCASGGVFACIAKYVIEQNGIVYGVIYDEKMKVCHSRTDNLKDLKKMYSSKYVQSNTKNTYKQAKSDLDSGKLVLYSGTPCQIAGLKSYLKKDYDNLITIDLVCHGVPSPLVFERYKNSYSANIINVDFRNKNNGWNPYNVEIKTTKNTIIEKALKNTYCRLFLSDLSPNSACYDCQFNKLPRVADLTIGDFWGVDSYDKSLNDNKGLSIVLVNSEKGQKVIKNIKDGAKIQEVPLDIVIKCNLNIVGSSKPHPQREEFFEDIKNGKSLKYCIKKYIKDEPLRIKIYRILPQFAKNFIKYKILKIEKKG